MGDAMGDLRVEPSRSNITMSYTKRKPEYATPMGDSFTDLIKCGTSAVGAVVGGVADPYLPEALCRISQLQALGKGRTPLQAMFGKKPTVTVPSCKQVVDGQKSIGFDRAVKPLRKLVYVNRHPAIIWLGLTALLGVPMLIGYAIGKKTK
jgi:hypothetical protein